jgi:recombination protein RecA
MAQTDLDKLIKKSGAEPVTVGDVEFSTTGLLGLDWALGGGLARGRISEFHGLESSGKSTIGLQAAIAEAQRTGIPALWLDYEYAWDHEYVEGLGMVDGQILVAQPESIENGFQLALDSISGGYVSSVWFDSTGVMVSEEKGVASMTNARAIAQGLPKLIRAVAQAQVVCGFISQTREVIQTGGFGGWSVGPKRKATGGAAIKFAFSQRVEFTHKAKLKGRAQEITGAESDGVIGRRVIAKVMKNKVGVPWREMEFDLIDGVGFDRIRHLIELGVGVDVVQKKGAFYEVPGLPKSVQGIQTLAAVLRDSRAVEVLLALEEQITVRLSDVEGVELNATNQEVLQDVSEDIDEG